MRDIKEEIKKLYQKLQDEAGFKVGDKVKITRKAGDFESGWPNTWVESKMFANKTGKIISIGINIVVQVDKHSWGYPYFVLEKIEETYHIGQKFLCDGDEYVLCTPKYHEIGLINSNTGNRWGDNTEVKDIYKITVEEMLKHTSYWNRFVLVE